MIDQFRGEYRWLSNFGPGSVTMPDGILYLTREAAFMAQKTEDMKVRRKFAELKTGIEARRAGRPGGLIKDFNAQIWNNRRVDIMYQVVYLCFTQNLELAEKLLATKDSHLEEGNQYGDMFYGTVNGKGENHLGRILMSVRQRLQEKPPT